MKENRTSRLTEGCRIHDDCLNCPLPVCIEDMTPEDARRAIRRHEDERIDRGIREMTTRGMTKRQAVTSLAERMGLSSTSNIYWRLKRQRERENGGRR